MPRGIQPDFEDLELTRSWEMPRETGWTDADPLPVVDGLLAATASVRNWILVTRNVADVNRAGVRVLNPFEPN